MEGEHLNSSVVFQLLGYFIRKNQWAKKEFSNFTHPPSLYILAKICIEKYIAKIFIL